MDSRGSWKSIVRWLIRAGAGGLGRLLPLPLRRALVVRVGRGGWSGSLEFSMGLLHDVRRRDLDGLHRFLWSNHLAYAASYEVRKRFGAININPTRHLLFRDILAHLAAGGIDASGVASVFEVGCSMGYLLRHLETDVFPAAQILHGLDIDRPAIEAGTAHLRSLESKVRLFAADVEDAERIMGGRAYDIVLCCGVLMYMNETAARRLVRTMLTRAHRMVGLICLAHPQGAQSGSAVRPSDGTFIHDVHRMIREENGRLVSSKWVGTEFSGSSPAHVMVAEGASGAPRDYPARRPPLR
jgi:SAM-dependent methyltransferase